MALGKRDEDTLTSLAGRLARLDREISHDDARKLAELSGGKSLSELSGALLSAIDPDKVEAASRRLLQDQELACTAERANFFDPSAPLAISQANLPHWKQDHATYFVTFRLVDSLPQEKLQQWAEERTQWLSEHPEPLSDEAEKEYHARFSARIEDWLDQSAGSCALELPECKELVANALRHFDRQRYTLGEFVVASNHVHVLVTPMPGHNLSDILHSWKSFTAKQIIKVEAASRRLQPWWEKLNDCRIETAKHPADVEYVRPVWQKESFDHIVRSPASLLKFEEYIRDHREWEGKRRDAASTSMATASRELVDAACAPFDVPALRDALAKAKQDAEQTIDSVTVDEVLSQGFDAVAKEKATSLVQAFRDYIAQHQAEIDALQILYSRPYNQRLTEPMLKELEKKLRDNHAAWTEDNLWNAFAVTAPGKVRGKSQTGRFADLVSLVRFALEQQLPEIEGLPELPDGWCYASAEQVCSTVASGSTPVAPKMFSGSGEVPFLKVYNLTHKGVLDFSVKPTFVERRTHEGPLARSCVFPQDVSMNIVGPPLGNVSLVPDTFPEWNINQAIVVFRPTEAIQNRLLMYWLLSDDVLGKLERTAKATAGQFNLQVTACRKLALPLPPLAEQARIVAEVERRFSVVDELEATVSANLQRATQLRQAILARAFAG